MTINAHQFRFFDMKLVCNFHVMGFLHLLLSHMPVTNKAIVIHSFISEKITGEQLAGPRVAIHTSDTGRVNRRG
jgi:hypothetical protein